MGKRRWAGVAFSAWMLFLGCGGGSGPGSPGVTSPPPPAPIVVRISPGNASLLMGESQQFTATVTGTSNQEVYWFVMGVNGGWINNAGLYMATGLHPSTPCLPGTYTIMARSKADQKTEATATVTVGVPPTSPPRAVAFLSGSTRGMGNRDGVGTEALVSVSAMVQDSKGDLLVNGNKVIRRITPAGVVTTIAGSVGSPGHVDGTGPEARFEGPRGLAIDGADNLYIFDRSVGGGGAFSIRKMTPAGVVSTVGNFSGVLNAGGLAVGPDGSLYTTDRGENTILRITPAGVMATWAGMPGAPGTLDGPLAQAQFRNPSALAFDGAGNLFIADTNNGTIREISPAGTVTTFAGSPSYGDPDNTRHADGTGTAARFKSPEGLGFDAQGNLYVTDTGNTDIRKITPSAEVTTIAGATADQGMVDGIGMAARFGSPGSPVVDANGNVYVADGWSGNSNIRRVTPAGEVSTFVGSRPANGYANGPGADARFWDPIGVAIDPQGNVFVADNVNQVIRKITPDGTTSLFAGVPLSPGHQDGPVARFYYPYMLAFGPNGDLYVADTFNHVIRRITPAGVTSTVAGAPGLSGYSDGVGANARFHRPKGIVVDPNGVIYVADSWNSAIRRVSPSGEVTTLVSQYPSIGSLGGEGLGMDAVGNLYIAGSSVRRISPSGQITVVAGDMNLTGSVDGIGTAARFKGAQGLAVAPDGTVYVADYWNHTIREVSPLGVVTTLVGRAGIAEIMLGPAPGGLVYPTGIALAPNGDLVITTNHAVVRAVKP